MCDGERVFSDRSHLLVKMVFRNLFSSSRGKTANVECFGSPPLPNIRSRSTAGPGADGVRHHD